MDGGRTSVDNRLDSLLRDVDDPTPEQRRQLDALKWHHTLRFGSYETEALSPLGGQLRKAGYMPDDLSGTRVLDMGAADGYYSFVAEERGADRVLAIDNPKKWRKESGASTFELAKSLYGYERVEYRIMDVVDVDSLDEQFDYALFLGLYYHLTDPIRAFHAIYDALAPGGRVLVEGDVIPGRASRLHYYGPTYCAGSLPFFETVARQAGYSDLRVLSGTWHMRDRWEHYQGSGLSSAGRLARCAASSLAWGLGIVRPGLHRVIFELVR